MRSFERGKTKNARRYVGLTDRVRDALASAKRRNEKHTRADSPYVFPSPKAKAGHFTWLSAVWSRAMERVKVELRGQKQLAPGLVPYCARHTFATDYLMDGGDLGQLMRLMGHSDIQTTMRYVHLVEGHRSGELMNLAQ